MLQGFVTVGVVIALGALLARTKVVDAAGADLLARLSLVVAGPALMVVMLSSTDVGSLLSTALVATAAGVAVSLLLYVAIASRTLDTTHRSLMIGGLAAVFVNSGSLGIPIAAYVLDDAGAVLPMLVVQLLLLQPVALLLIDSFGVSVGAEPVRLSRMLPRTLSHPLILGTLLGLLLAVTGWPVPAGVDDALGLVAALAVPAMLLSYGAALVHGPPIGRGTPLPELGLITVVKLGVHPLATYLLGRYAFGLEGDVLLGITVVAALPSAQNVFVFASRYGRGVVLARDAILVTTVLAVPVVLAIGWRLG